MSEDIKNLVFCFTGKCPLPRNKMEAIAVQSGYSVSRSVTQKTDILVSAQGMGTSSSKAIKAFELGLDIITPDEFFDMCEGYNYIPMDEPEYVKPKDRNQSKNKYSQSRRVEL